MKLLVLQFAGDTIVDFDWLNSVEDRIVDVLTDGDEVDGHDMGNGEMNIFILSGNPTQTFTRIMKKLPDIQSRGELRAAYRDVNGDSYSILWPRSATKFKVT